jgi:hypothetical protein
VWAGLDSEVAADLKERVSALGRLGDEEREAALDAWQLEDRLASDPGVAWTSSGAARQRGYLARLTPRWQRVILSGVAWEAGQQVAWVRDDQLGGAVMRIALAELIHERERRRVELFAEHEFDPAWLARVPPARLGSVIARIGVFELASSLRHQGRRDVARVIKELEEPLRGWMLEELRRERALDEQERARADEVFVVMSRRHERWEDRALHTGLYFVAAAAGRRLASRLERLREVLPATSMEALRLYQRMQRTTSRRAVSAAVRRSLGALMPELSAIAGLEQSDEARGG